MTKLDIEQSTRASTDVFSHEYDVLLSKTTFSIVDPPSVPLEVTEKGSETGTSNLR